MKLFVFLLFIPFGLFAQTDSTFKFTLPQLKIYQHEKKKDVSYDFDNEKNIFFLSDSLLTANPEKYKYSVPLADIKKISVRDGTYVWKTAGIIGGVTAGFGLLIGATVYALVSKASNESNLILVIPALTLIGAFVGGVVGVLVGFSVPYYENYTMREKDLAKKKEMLKKIFSIYNLNKK